jgi:hypothetical protein
VLPLQKEHERQNFSCGSPALDRYLQSQARQDSEKRVAAMAVVVDANDALAADFYQHFGFMPLNLSVSRLFLPMVTVAKLFD